MVLIKSLIGQNHFLMQDSIELTSPDSSAFLTDVYYLDNELYANFSKIASDSNFTYLVKSNKFFKFSGERSLDFDITCNLSFGKKGFILPKYFGNKLFEFDTTNYIAIQNNMYAHTNVRTKGISMTHYSYAGSSNYYELRNDAITMYPYVIFHCVTYYYDANEKKEKKTKRTIEKIFKDENLFLKYNIETGKVESTFAKYPDIYKSNPAYIVNKRHYFTCDPRTNLIYSSLEADPNIYVYNLEGFIVDTFAIPGNFVRKDNMVIPLFNLGIVKGRNLYNSICDSYGPVSFFGDQLFRTYRTSLPFATIENEIQFIGGSRCVPPQVEESWINIQLSKPKHLQQIGLNGKLIAELPFPKNMNVFVGFDESNHIYYFRKLKLGKDNLDRGKVIIYKYTVGS